MPKKNETPVNPAHAPLIAQRDAILTQLGEVDKQLAAIAGSLSAKTKRITDEIVSAAPDISDVEQDVIAVKTESLLGHVRTLVDRNPVRARNVIDDILVDMKNLRDEANEAILSQVRAQLKATSASSDEASTLKATRVTLADQAAAFNTVLVQMGAEAVEIPAAPRVGGGGGGGGHKVSRSGVEYYRGSEDDPKWYGADRSLSLIAFHAGLTTGELEKILRDAGVEDLTKPFNVTVEYTATKGKKSGKNLSLQVGCRTVEKPASE